MDWKNYHNWLIFIVYKYIKKGDTLFRINTESMLKRLNNSPDSKNRLKKDSFWHQPLGAVKGM